MSPETFDQFYARLSANRKAAIATETDPVKKAELITFDECAEAQWKAAWEVTRGRARNDNYALSQDTLDKIREDHRQEGREVSQDNGTYSVVNGEAW